MIGKLGVIGVNTSTPQSARVVAFSIASNATAGLGPYDVDQAIQLHGLSSAQVSYTLVPAAGGLPSGVSPDAAQVPVSGFPLILPAGASLVINNTGAGTRAYSASIWPI